MSKAKRFDALYHVTGLYPRRQMSGRGFNVKLYPAMRQAVAAFGAGQTNIEKKPADGSETLPSLDSREVVKRKAVYTTKGREQFGKIPDDLVAWIAEQRAAVLKTSPRRAKARSRHA